MVARIRHQCVTAGVWTQSAMFFSYRSQRINVAHHSPFQLHSNTFKCVGFCSWEPHGYLETARIPSFFCIIWQYGKLIVSGEETVQSNGASSNIQRPPQKEKGGQLQPADPLLGHCCCVFYSFCLAKKALKTHAITVSPSEQLPISRCVSRYQLLPIRT